MPLYTLSRPRTKEDSKKNLASFRDTATFFIFEVNLVETLNTAIFVTLCSICLFSLTFFQRFFFVCLDKENLNLIAFVSLDLAGQSFSQFRADSHAWKLLFPSSLLALIMHSYLEIQCGGQQIILQVLSCHHSKICAEILSPTYCF